MAVASASTFAPESGAHHRTRRAVEAYIEQLIGLLDELDEDPDLEDAADAEPDDDAEPDQDGEPLLGWPESFGRRRQLSFEGQCLQALGDDWDTTAPERFGKGFVRSAPDDHEDSHDAEAVNEDGCDLHGSDSGIADMDGASESWFGQDGEGEFAGGCLLGADGKPEPTTDVNPDAWVRA